MEAALQAKYEKLLAYLKEHGGAVIGFSGGVDSTFLLYAAHEAMADMCLAVTIRSAFSPQDELAKIEKLVKRIGARHRYIDVDVLGIPRVAENGTERCYYCKQALFGRIQAVAQETGCVVMDGSNADDVKDVRPGRRALRELGVESPLEELEWTKEEIRRASKALGLPTWDAPSMACLASRVPYGEAIMQDKLAAVDKAETFLRRLGIGQLRVRHHGDTARIEVTPGDMERVMQHREAIVGACQDAGFRFAALDLHGFKSGNMNAL